MWSKISQALVRATGPRRTPSSPNASPLNTTELRQPKSSPFNQQGKRLAAQQPPTKLPTSITKFGDIPTFNGQPIASLLSTWTSKTMQAPSSIKSCWNKSWNAYKNSAPTGARQTHFAAIRNEVMLKYGVLAHAILAILSAAATDTIFWWLAELLLSDGM